MEAVDDAGQGEIQGPKPQDGEDVGGIDDERVGGDGEDGRDGVQGEDHVRDLDQRQHDEKRRDVRHPVSPHEKLPPLEALGHPEVAAHEQVDAVFGDVRFLPNGHQHLDPREHQKGPEHVDDPVEGVEDGRPGQDERPAQHQRAQDAPEQDRVLVAARHGKMQENQDEDEDVVDGQAFFDEVAGEVFLPGLGPEKMVDARPEAQGQDHVAQA